MGARLSGRLSWLEPRNGRREETSLADGDSGGDDDEEEENRQEDIARFPYVEFTGKDSVTCPSCQGTGRIPKEQLNELVALIPYSDQRLQPQRTKLYVFISISLCLLISGLAGFFLFPRSLVVNDDGIKVVMIKFDTNNSRVFIDMTSTLNISNSNFYSVSVDTLTCQVEYMKTVIGTTQLTNVSIIAPLSENQVNYTVRIEFGGPLAYVYTFCTMPSIKVHNIVVFMQTTVKSSYLGHSSQNSLEDDHYLDCGSNSTVHRRPPWAH